jgi:hypothetical protein
MGAVESITGADPRGKGGGGRRRGKVRQEKSPEKVRTFDPISI